MYGQKQKKQHSSTEERKSCSFAWDRFAYLHICNCNLQCRLLLDLQIMGEFFVHLYLRGTTFAEVDLSLAPPTVSTCVTSQCQSSETFTHKVLTHQQCSTVCSPSSQTPVLQTKQISSGMLHYNLHYHIYCWISKSNNASDAYLVFRLI